MKKSYLIIFIILGVTATACGAGGTNPTPTEESSAPVLAEDVLIAEGRVEPVRYAEIALNANGLISEVLAAEGSPVSAGDVIARLESAQAQTLADAQAEAYQKLSAAYQAVRDAQFDLDNYDIPNEFSGMTATEAVSSTLGKLNTARDNFEPYKNLSEKRLELTDKEKEDEEKIYRDTAKLYKKRLDDAWSSYRKAIQWMELESALETADAELTQAQKDSARLMDPSFSEDSAGVRAALANAELRAPFSGTITESDLKIGEFAASGQPVVTLADLSDWVVKTTDLTELDVVGVQEGQPVVVILDAIPDKELKGYVFKIGQGYTEKQGDIVYEVIIFLTEKIPDMRWGMTAEVRFEH